MSFAAWWADVYRVHRGITETNFELMRSAYEAGKADACGSPYQSTELLAHILARAIFESGDNDPDYGGKTQRIQFMGGKYPGNEKRMGGLCEKSLASLIDRTLSANASLTGGTK